MENLRPADERLGGVASRPSRAQRASDATLLRSLRALFSKATWMTTAYLAVYLVLGGLFAGATAIALVVSLATAWIVGVGVVVRAGALRLTARMARFDCRRIERRKDHIELLTLPEPAEGTSFRQRQREWSSAAWLWRLPVYQFLRLTLAGAMAFFAVGWWWSSIVCFVLVSGPITPTPLLGWQIGPTNPNTFEAAMLVAAGIGGILAWPALARATRALDVSLARALLEPNRSRQLAAEVSRLSTARSLAVESAEAERRRIERDLHDGLQPQLVGIALDLGLAKARLDRDPVGARSMVERAHEEAKRATADLRNLVRGIHPAVLDERGLDAALSALVASCPVPVSVEVSLEHRPDPTRESVAYFVIAEAITNVTKHARAEYATVIVISEKQSLHVLVEDDGQGGARLEPGGGLTGLAARVASVDGTLTLSSPDGGPTRIEAVIPCGP